MLSSRAEAICNLYVCVHQVTFTSSSVEKWRVEMIINGKQEEWKFSELNIVWVGTILDWIFWIGVIRVGNLWVGIFRMGIVRVEVILGGNFPRWEFSGWELAGGNHPGGNFPGGCFPSTSLVLAVFASTCLY